MCTGSNEYGQLGAGPLVGGYSASPVQVTGLAAGASAIAAGAYHACALVNGGAKCWGDNRSGELGGGNDNASSVPVEVAGLSAGVSAIEAGESHACAIVNGGIQCSGNNKYGQLGDGSTHSSRVPVAVVGLSAGASAVAAGGSQTCAIVNGGIACWGDNTYGQLGNGDTSRTASLSPINVVGISAGASVTAVGRTHACAIVDGGARCWGDNGQGQLGNGESSNAANATPIGVLELSSGVSVLSSGFAHTCAGVRGQVRCWGDNRFAQLGVGPTPDICSTGFPCSVRPRDVRNP